MATTFGSEEITIDSSKTSLVETSVRKIDRLFGVKIAFDVLSTEGGDCKQWLVVSGTKESRSNATSYILAMCHPEQTTQVSCQGKPHLDDVVLEDVERKTSAYLVRTGSQSLQVMGSEHACLLAISQLKQTYHITMVSKEAVGAGQSKKSPGHVGKKSHKGKPKGDTPEHSTRPSKPKAASVCGKSSEVTDPSNAGSDIPASHSAKQQASNLSQAVRPIAIANQPSGTSTETAAADSDLRFIVIDGQNVAMSHGNDKVFSCKGIKLCVDYFLQRGHRVKAWVPLTMTYTRQTGRVRPVVDQHILEELKDQGYLGYTPARKLNGRHIVSHDDYFILNHAKLEDAVVVTRDNFRGFVRDYRDIIENRLLSFVFTDDYFMLPQDPLGRYGPTLDEFLRKKTSKSVIHPAKGPTASTAASSDPSVAFGQPYKAFGEPGRAFGQPGKAFGQPNPGSVPRQPQGGQVGSLLGPSPAASGPQHAAPRPSHSVSGSQGPKPLLSGDSDACSATLIRPSQLNVVPPRHPNVTHDLLEALRAVFPGADQEAKIKEVLDNHPADTDLDNLVNYCINALNV